MLFRETIAAHSETDTKPRNTLCEKSAKLVNVKAGGT
jgi:hypothetical protein